jgi:hypothetical protein
MHSCRKGKHQQRHHRHALGAERYHRASQRGLAAQALELDLDDGKQVRNGEHDQAGHRQRKDASLLLAGVPAELCAAARTVRHVARMQGRTAVDRIATRADHGVRYFLHR